MHHRSQIRSRGSGSLTGGPRRRARVALESVSVLRHRRALLAPRMVRVLLVAVLALSCVTLVTRAVWAGNAGAPDGRIAYVIGSLEGRTDVGSLRPTGTGARNLTSSAPNELYVDVSPDGQTIAFARFTRHAAGDIFTVPVAGGSVTRVTSDLVHDELPIWSPDSSRIALVRYAEGEDAEIFVMDADGSDLVRVTDNTAEDVDPRWSPDGTQLIYNSGNLDENGQDVFLVTLGQPGAAPLTEPGVNDTFAEWSPNGSTIAYASYRNEQWDLYLVSADGSTTTQLTTDPADDYAPKWSPEGTRLVYVNGRLEGELPADRLRVIGADGAGISTITPGRLDAFSASWSPSGERIVFVGETGGDANWELFTVAPDGTGLTRLTRTDAMEFDPTWARRAESA